MAEDGLTNEEAEQYDRQIRLWGLEAQKRLRTAKILMIGLGGLSAEVCKDIVLAGVKSLTIADSRDVSDNDIANRFLCNSKGMNRAESALLRLQALNPNVLVKAEPNTAVITDEYCQQFDLICVTCSLHSELLRINEICRKHNIKFFCGDTWGYYGYFFTDLQEHHYTVDVQREKLTIELDIDRRRESNVEEETGVVTEKRTISFCSLYNALSVDWSKKDSKYFRRTPTTFFIIQILQAFRDETGRDPEVEHIEEDQVRLKKLYQEVTNQLNISMDLVKEDFVNYCFSELSPVCAIVGGVLSQEIIKAISANDAPFQNTFLYDGVNGTGIVEKLHS